VAEACGGVETVGRNIEANESDRRLRVEDVKIRTVHNPKSAAHGKAKCSARKGWPAARKEGTSRSDIFRPLRGLCPRLDLPSTWAAPSGPKAASVGMTT
jgi:hypothetical protein